MRSVSPGFEDTRLRVTYENVNLKNHLPFADKSLRDICPPDDRFKTFYTLEQSSAAHRQTSQVLLGNLDRNNSLNKFYKKRLLDENHKLGHQNKRQELDNLKSEQHARQDEVNNPTA